jgi:hypothetical protein
MDICVRTLERQAFEARRRSFDDEVRLFGFVRGCGTRVCAHTQRERGDDGGAKLHTTRHSNGDASAKLRGISRVAGQVRL